MFVIFFIFFLLPEVWLRDLPAWVFGFNLASSFVASSGEGGPRRGLGGYLGRELQPSLWSLLM